MKHAISLLLLALAAPAVLAAEDMYRSVMPDGRVLYGESAAPGAKSVKKMPAPPVSTGVTVITPAEQARGAPTPAPGGVAVIPQPPRPRTPPAEQGLIQSPPGTMPKRSY